MASGDERSQTVDRTWALIGLIAVVLIMVAIGSSGDLGAAAIVSATVAVGCIVGRWWLLVIPAAAFLFFLGAALFTDTCDPSDGCYEEIPPLGVAFILGLYLAIAEAALTVGIVLRKALLPPAIRRP